MPYAIVPHACPFCDSELSHVIGADSRMNQGTKVLCVYCGQWCIVHGEALRLASPEELEAASDEEKRTLRFFEEQAAEIRRRTFH